MMWFLIVGLISGWLAGTVSKGGGFGLWGDLLTGIIGAYVGGFLFSLLGISAYGVIGSIVVSTIGAIVFLWAVRMVTRNKKTI